MPIEEGEVKKLLGTVWFRGVVPELSDPWRQRVVEVLATGTIVTDHRLKVDHRGVRLSEIGYEQLSDIVKRTSVPDAARADVALLMSVGRLWGPEAIARFTFVDAHNGARPGFAGLFQGLRH